jgi:hypothetical protein
MNEKGGKSICNSVSKLNQVDINCGHLRINYRTAALDDYRITKIAKNEWQWMGLTFTQLQHKGRKVIANYQTGSFIDADPELSIKEIVNRTIYKIAPLLANLRCEMMVIDFPPEILFIDNIRLFRNLTVKKTRKPFKNAQTFEFGMMTVHQKIDSKGVWLSADLEGDEYIKEFKLDVFSGESVLKYCKIIRLIQINHLQDCSIKVILQSNKLKLSQRGEFLDFDKIFKRFEIGGMVVENVSGIWMNEIMPNVEYRKMVISEMSKSPHLRTRYY